MAITASDVKKLREMTGAGMMQCKNALKETNGDVETAVDYLRTKGLAAAQKKQSRIAAEGTVVTIVNGNKGVVLEVNCETDFVSRGDDFQNFSKGIAEYALNNSISDIAALKKVKEAEVNERTLKCGEKVDLRRLEFINAEGGIGNYNHGGKIGVLVNVSTTGDASNADFQELMKDLAMHVAATSPKFVNADDIDETFKNKEAEIYRAQLIEEGKPEAILDKIIVGKLNKLAKDVCLLEQAFVKDPDTSIKKLVADVASKMDAEVKIVSFSKMNLGEGIEKKEDNLADEVAKMTGKQ